MEIFPGKERGSWPGLMPITSGGLFHGRGLNTQAVSSGEGADSSRPLRRLGIRTQVSNEPEGGMQTGRVKAVCRKKRRKCLSHALISLTVHPSLISSSTETNTFPFAQFPFCMQYMCQKNGPR